MANLKLNLSKKIPLVITGIATLAVIVTSLFLINAMSKEVVHQEGQKLVALQASRVAALDNYLSSIQEDLSSLSKNEYVRQALRDFMTGWEQIGPRGSHTKVLQNLYIDANPNPTGAKEELDYARDGSIYSQVHKRYHPWFRHFLRQRDYYDIFLFAPNGDLVYSVFKELDYATNLNTGKWKESDLGNAFRAAKASPKPDQQNFFDFKPYAPSHGAAASFISQAILNDNGSLAGVLVFQMPIARINNVMQVAAGMGESGETYIVGSDFYMRSDSRFSEESTILKIKVTGDTVEQGLSGETGVDFVDDYRGISVLSAYGPYDFMGTRWAIMAEMDEAEVMEPIYGLQIKAAIKVLLLLLISAVVGVVVARGISRPISAMVVVMKQLAGGDFSVDVPGMNRSDEIGDMASSLEVFRENGIETKRLQEQAALSEQRAEEEKQRVMEELATQFDTQVGGTIQSLSVASEKLQGAASNMENTAKQTASASATVASAAAETSTNVSTVASATEEMSASAKEISTQINNVAQKSGVAFNGANGTSEKVEMLNQLVENIGEVVLAIKNIADQTNLLALNATIEAARAGDAGKGFAVVADEVKKLATETGAKTEEIETRITEIQEAAQEAVQSMKDIIDSISEIDEASAGTASAVEEQNSVISEIGRNITEVSQAADQVASEIGSVQTASNETDQASQMLMGAANDITGLSDSLSKDVDAFLEKIRGNQKQENYSDAAE